MFLDPFSESSRSFSKVRGLTPICLAFPVVDNILLSICGVLVFGVHEQGFEGVYPLEKNLYSDVLEDLLERLTQTLKIGD